MKTSFLLLVGDPFLRKQKSESLAASIEKEEAGPFERQKFDLRDTPMETVLAAARTLPFLAHGQILQVCGAECLKEKERFALEAYLASPSLRTVLFFEADELKDKGELLKLAKEKGRVLILDKGEAKSSGTAFLKQKLALYRKTMTPGAQIKLLAMCGDAVVFLDTMVDRLAQFAGERAAIDETMVSAFEENWAGMDAFKLTNAFLDRDPARGLKTFRDLMELYEADLTSIVGILHWQLRQLWQAAVLLEEGMTEREVSSRCRMPPFRMKALRQISLGRLESALEALHQIDKGSKTGQLEGVAGIEAWLLKYSA
ncbi:MAG: DNA polymerase III subunit delta [Candidatus Omnitrophica bacterium]|nr:DNA polymerase III subunit delta [Candidatus Omnitrophota bacterium]